MIARDIAALRDEDRITPDLAFRDPYFLDFLGLPARTYSEKDVEAAILRELEAFILELGTDFAFVARQKRISVDSVDYYLDLLFYHRRLRRLVAVELKIEKFEAAHKAVRSGSLCGRRCLMLLLTCLFENPMSRRMVAEYARLHLLMPTTAGGCFPPAIAPRAWQSLPHALAQLGRCRYLAQQREQRIHLDQLADCHHLPLHVVEQLLVEIFFASHAWYDARWARTTCSALYISRQNDI